jgi:UDP-glucose 4-epimerase
MTVLDGSTLLITGGTGSFGNAMLIRALGLGIREIRIFSRDEKKQDDMRRLYADERLKFFIGDVRDSDAVKNAMYGVDYVFHSAALKQIPSCDFFPLEAVKTNVFGADNVLSACVEMGVKRVVCLSTDKAAYPINAMGISKAMMEKVIIAKARSVRPRDIVICCTRYGNVMCSRGSVIPVFIQQIKEGRPITVTDPAMTRFLMSLSQAVELVLWAFANGETGDLFIQKSPACTIADLAEAVRRLFDPQAAVKVIGTRHSEKKYETLLTTEEKARALDEGDYVRVPMDARDLNYEQYFQGDEKIDAAEPYTSENTRRLSVEDVMTMLAREPYVRQELKGWRA